MSSPSSIAKLSSPLKELVLGAIQSEGGSGHLGKTEKDQSEVTEWIDKVVQGDVAKESNLEALDTELTPRTYIVGNYLTAADVALYGALHPVVSKLSPPKYYSHPSLTRYFDHIQTRPAVRKSADALSSFELVKFDLENAPKLERKPEQPAKKKEKAKETVKDAKPTVKHKPMGITLEAKLALQEEEAAAESAKSAAAGGEAKLGKKEKKKDGAAPAKEAKGKNGPAADDGPPVPSMIDLRVGHIVDVKKHPDADGLYVEQIDIGEETGPRTILSGLVHYIPREEMRDKYLVVVCNLKPANMRGIKSYGMVLAATHKDGKEAGIELIQPPPGSKPGDRVYFEGAEYENAEPLAQLNPKKKIFETIQPGFTTLDSKEAAWVNPAGGSVHKIRTKNGVCVAPTLVGASLS
jgi:aminoacyl tRNA synthase complex-interacting multifunctional protein 1